MDRSSAPVMVAVDGTEISAGAIKFAIQEARSRGVGLTVVHVSPSYIALASVGSMMPMMGSLPPLMEETSQRLLAKMCAEIELAAPDLTIRSILRTGPVSGSILDATGDAQVLVVGQETRTGLDRWAAGATAMKVAAHAECPVVAVPALWCPVPARHRLVVGVRSVAAAPDLLAQAFEMAAARKDTLVVLHAWRLPDPYFDAIEARTHMDEWIEEGQRLLDEVLAEPRAAFPDVTVEARVVHREPARALVEAARDADMLVLSRRTHEHLQLTRLGSTARAVLRHATVPVSVLPAHARQVAAGDQELDRSGHMVR
ncbi:MAG: universal stress protein [Nocardioides sp.]|uniref:universal stress protein n=1 Tax=Nocardioides sp. TaxID=35761 RepID=UPI00326445B2